MKNLPFYQRLAMEIWIYVREHGPDVNEAAICKALAIDEHDFRLAVHWAQAEGLLTRTHVATDGSRTDVDATYDYKNQGD